MARLPASTRLARAAGVWLAVMLLASACAGNQNYVELSSERPVAELAEGISISANPAAVPSSFRVQLAAVEAAAFAAGEAGEAWAEARAALPPNLTLQSPVFEIKTRGDLPEQVFVSVQLPTGEPGTVLDLYAWSGGGWDFLPAQLRGSQLVASLAALPPAVALFEPAALPPLAFLALEPGQALYGAAASAANAVLLGGVRVEPDGSLSGQLPGVPADGAYALYPVVSTTADQAALLAELLGDEALRANHLQTLLSFTVAGGYDGVVLDYAGLPAEQAPGFAQFVHDLSAQLRAQGKGLYVEVGPAVPAGEAFSTGGYDWRALGEAADGLLLPIGDDPTAFGNGQADALLAWAVGEVPRGRLRLMTSGLSVEGVEGQFSLVDHATALAPLGSATLAEELAEVYPGDAVAVKLSGPAQSLAYDGLAFAASYGYTGADGKARTLWLTSADTLRQRLALAEKYQLGGVVVTDLLAAGVPAALLNAVTQYKAAVDAAAQAQAALRWTVQGANGVLAQATAQPNQPYIYVPPAAGSYQFSAELNQGESIGLGSVAVEVAELAATETPAPEATPTATRAVTSGNTAVAPAHTATSAPAGATPAHTATGAPAGATPAPTATRPPTGGGVFVPPPPIGAGNFELGGQVPGFIGNAASMQQAGMRWVKFQVRGGGHDLVAAGKGAGFKVLLSVIGDKGRATDPAYWDEYAAWVGSLAAAGADAIEVWNEPNIDHEWPEGQISAATYTQLLAKAYNAIKANNGGTLVISAGPSPTGAEGAFPGRVVNDDRFVREMAAAGAANYMDCVGTHFNQGTTSPSASSGAPLLSGYHYSYYFWPMVDTYWNAFGGSRPLCFTELGYLTGEGIGALPGNFAWASETSLAEQAQWLAEAASLAGNSGKVRLMIVWNVDFTFWGGDPQAGYAIVRPDGSCPACAALGAVMP